MSCEQACGLEKLKGWALVWFFFPGGVTASSDLVISKVIFMLFDGKDSVNFTALHVSVSYLFIPYVLNIVDLMYPMSEYWLCSDRMLVLFKSRG